MGNHSTVVVVDRARVFEDNNFLATLATKSILEVADGSFRFETGNDALTIDRIDVQAGRSP